MQDETCNLPSLMINNYRIIYENIQPMKHLLLDTTGAFLINNEDDIPYIMHDHDWGIVRYDVDPIDGDSDPTTSEYYGCEQCQMADWELEEISRKLFNTNIYE